jgi:dihydropteroate synthase
MTSDAENSPVVHRAPQWRLARRVLTFGRMPRLMGIVNVTPDSFSDGGQFLEAQRAIEHGLKLAAEGADILDIGGESTRPYSAPVDVDEELRRVIPVVKGLAAQVDVPLSIDTSKAAVARAALDAGAEIINDVTGGEGDPRMLEVLSSSQAGVCVMHMQGTPQTMQDNPDYEDVVTEVRDYLRRRQQHLLEHGVARECICLDPGIGFGKSTQHNLDLLIHTHRLHSLGSPVLIGYSRKGFICRVLGNDQADRFAGGLGVALSLARQGVQVLRVHEVASVHQALQLFAACGGLDPVEP